MSIAVKRAGKLKTVGIYLDNAASAPLDPLVIKEMAGAEKLFGNPSSYNNAGRSARQLIDKSRLKIARFLGCSADGIIFTSSGSEANNLAILGSAGDGKGEILYSPIEHPSVLEPIKELQKKGHKITALKVDRTGIVDLDDLRDKLNPAVRLISVMYANNEIGTIQPVKKISRIINNYKKQKPEIDGKMYPIFHVDACQAAGYLDMKVNNLGADLLVFNGTKIHGPKGIGVLCVGKGVVLNSMILGGDQERGYRAGTENTPAIAGLAKAVELIDDKDSKKVSGLRDYFISGLMNLIPGIRLNGPIGGMRLANNINVSFPDLDSENILLELDKYRISAGSGSACTARSVEPSHVLKSIGVEREYINGAIRFSLGRQTVKREIDYVLKVLPKVTGDLRKRYNK